MGLGETELLSRVGKLLNGRVGARERVVLVRGDAAAACRNRVVGSSGADMRGTIARKNGKRGKKLLTIGGEFTVCGPKSQWCMLAL